MEGGSVQIYLHEDGLKTPVAATRLSDGTIRFLALLALLLHPMKASLLCLEEPELGLHPDALGIIAELLIEAKKQDPNHCDDPCGRARFRAFSEEADSVLTSMRVTPSAWATEFFGVLETKKLEDWPKTTGSEKSGGWAN